MADKKKQIHVHCFSDSPELARRLLDHFPNLYIGITGNSMLTQSLSTQLTGVSHAQVSQPILQISIQQP